MTNAPEFFLYDEAAKQERGKKGKKLKYSDSHSMVFRWSFFYL